MKLPTITLLLISIGLAHGQSPKAFLEQLNQTPASPELFQTMMQVSKQMEAMPAGEVKDLLPLIFKAISDDKAGTKGPALLLFAISRRSDSGAILKGTMQDMQVLLNSPDGRLKAIAGAAMTNMHPQPPEVSTMLLAVANGNGPLNQRIDALSAMVGLENPPKDQIEAAAIRILKDPGLDSHTRLAAIRASAYRDSSDNLVDAIAEGLGDKDWQVRMQSVLSLRGFGPRAIGKYHSTLAKLANDKDETEAVRVMAQNTLNGKDEKCVTLQALPDPKLVPIPNCKVK
jgi:hypothetical protein